MFETYCEAGEETESAAGLDTMGSSASSPSSPAYERRSTYHNRRLLDLVLPRVVVDGPPEEQPDCARGKEGQLALSLAHVPRPARLSEKERGRTDEREPARSGDGREDPVQRVVPNAAALWHVDDGARHGVERRVEGAEGRDRGGASSWRGTTRRGDEVKACIDVKGGQLGGLGFDEERGRLGRTVVERLVQTQARAIDSWTATKRQSQRRGWPSEAFEKRGEVEEQGDPANARHFGRTLARPPSFRVRADPFQLRRAAARPRGRCALCLTRRSRWSRPVRSRIRRAALLEIRRRLASICFCRTLDSCIAAHKLVVAQEAQQSRTSAREGGSKRGRAGLTFDYK